MSQICALLHTLLIDLLHESSLTLNPSSRFGRGTLKLAPLLPNLEEGLRVEGKFLFMQEV